MLKHRKGTVAAILFLVGGLFLISPFNYRKLNVPNYNQIERGIPEGCEGVSLLEGLHYKKNALDETPVTFLEKIPRAASPENGFGGNPFQTQQDVFSAIYPEPLTDWGNYFGTIENISGASPNEIYHQVRQGNPVVTWVTIGFKPLKQVNWEFGQAPGNNHAVLVAGYNHALRKVYVSDPIDGKYWLSQSKFEHIYNARKMAVVVK